MALCAKVCPNKEIPGKVYAVSINDIAGKCKYLYSVLVVSRITKSSV